MYLNYGYVVNLFSTFSSDIDFICYRDFAMPRRKPIIPGFSGSKQLLKALHSEMRERKVIQDDQSTSSGIHSNSDVSDNSELAKNQTKNYNEGRFVNTMGRTSLKRVEYDYSQDKAEREHASSSSGPDDDGDDDDVSDDDNDDAGNEENDFDDGSNGSESDEDDDGFEEEKDAKETDDQIAWEMNTSVQRHDTKNYGASYGSSYATSQATRAGRSEVASVNRRVSGPISYTQQLKETDDEIELIRRKYCQARERQNHIDDQRAHQLSTERQREIKEKRMSAGSISFLYGRRQQPKQLPSNANYSNQTNGQTSEQVRIRSKSNPRGMEERARLLQMNKRRSLQLPVNASLSVKPVLETPKPKPRTSTSMIKNDDSDVEFPLKDLAAGHSKKSIGMNKAKSLERDAKRKTKALKGSIENAKLDVADARLGEFAAKLKARQARIEERQAKLCRRRAILKRMEDELIGLETKLDEEEEDHRARERRIKNRERRVKQEEAGIRLKEESLRKREAMVSEGIEKIEQRRKLVEEKESVHNAMEEIMAKKEEIHGREVARLEKQNKGGFFGKMSRKSGKDKSPTIRIQPSKIPHSDYVTSKMIHSGGNSTLPTEASGQPDNSCDSSQQNDSSTYYKTSPVQSTRTNGTSENGRLNMNSLKRPNGKTGVMGLWI